MYNIDFNNLIKQLLPKFLHGEKLIAWLNALLSPVVFLYDKFLSVTAAKRYETSYNGQVAELEYVLNDYYYSNGVLRLIYLEDDINNELYLYNNTELEDELLIYNTGESSTPVYLYQSHEGSGSPDFIVWVPNDLEFNASQMISLINKYKMAGPSYIIKTYSNSAQ